MSPNLTPESSITSSRSWPRDLFFGKPSVSDCDSICEESFGIPGYKICVMLSIGAWSTKGNLATEFQT
jgi:hypothetical protein